jgi:short-subunit dehydrogenase
MHTWIVTGASRGLGRHLALRLAARGDHVLACARDAQRLHELADAASAGAVTPVVLDLADAAAIRPTLLAAIEAAGSLDGVINNAGIGEYKPFEAHGEDELLRVLQVNLAASMQVCHVALPFLRARGAGHIVNIGSDLGRRPLANMAAYVASKHGLLGFSHSLARELRPLGIKVSLVNPGIIDTDFGGATEGSRDPHASLQPAQLAALIESVLSQPGNVLIDELTVHPLGQQDF